MPQQTPMPPVYKAIKTLVVDKAGNPVVMLKYREIIIVRPNGSTKEYKAGANIELVDGTVFNVGMLAGPRPVRLAVCELCREPPYTFPRRSEPTHGLCATGHRCRDCGRWSCPGHCEADPCGRWRCTLCARRNRRRRWVRRVFFR